jgi:hypothetical protein
LLTDFDEVRPNSGEILLAFQVRFCSHVVAGQLFDAFDERFENREHSFVERRLAVCEDS